MGLRLVEAGRTEPLPEVSHGVEADDPRALGDVEHQDVEDFEQHVRVGVIEVHLVLAEGRPDVPAPGARVDRLQQRRCARPDDRRQVRRRVRFDEVVPAGRDAGAVIQEPAAFPRDVVEHEIEHQPEPLAQGPDLRPIAQRRIHQPVMDHGEAVVRGGGEERQQVNMPDRAGQPLVEEPFQRDQRLLLRRADHVGIGDQYGIRLVPRRRGPRRGAEPVPPDQHRQPRQAPFRARPVEPLEPAPEPLHHGAGIIGRHTLVRPRTLMISDRRLRRSTA